MVYFLELNLFLCPVCHVPKSSTRIGEYPRLWERSRFLFQIGLSSYFLQQSHFCSVPYPRHTAYLEGSPLGELSSKKEYPSILVLIFSPLPQLKILFQELSHNLNLFKVFSFLNAPEEQYCYSPHSITQSRKTTALKYMGLPDRCLLWNHNLFHRSISHKENNWNIDFF